MDTANPHTFAPEVLAYAISQQNRILPASAYLNHHLPAINRQWQAATGLPRWLGWFINHHLMRVYTAYRKTSHDMAIKKMVDAQQAIHTAIKDKDHTDIRHAIWKLLLVKTLPSVLHKARKGLEKDLRKVAKQSESTTLTPKETAKVQDAIEHLKESLKVVDDVTHVIAESAKLRLLKERDKRVTSQQWADLEENIEECFTFITEQSYRKDPTSKREHDRMLIYTLDVARSACRKNTDTSLAAAYKDTLNALELFHEPKVKSKPKKPDTKQKPRAKPKAEKPFVPPTVIVSASFMQDKILRLIDKL